MAGGLNGRNGKVYFVLMGIMVALLVAFSLSGGRVVKRGLLRTEKAITYIYDKSGLFV